MASSSAGLSTSGSSTTATPAEGCNEDELAAPERADLPVVPEADEGLQVVRAGVGDMTLGEKLWDFKEWSVIQLECTRQFMGEWWGGRGRTVDLQLTERVGKMRSAREAYVKMALVAQAMRTTLVAMSDTQRDLAYLLNSMAATDSKIPQPLQSKMKLSSGAHMYVCNREKLLMAALDSFVHNVNTLVRVAIDDLLSQIPAYKAMRIEYDAYRNKLEKVKAAAKGTAAANRDRVISQAEEAFRPRNERFTAVRREFIVRVRFLEQNEVSVMRKQLVLLQNAMCAFYSGNTDTLHKCLEEFRIKAPKTLHDPAKSALAAAEESPFRYLSVGDLASNGVRRKSGDSLAGPSPTPSQQ